MKMYYFAYGSNLEIHQMKMRCKDSEPVTQAELPGYRLIFRGVADIEEAPGASVTGALYEISLNDLRALDIYEGFPTLYTRKEVFVTIKNEYTGKEIKVPVMVYQMTPKYSGSTSGPNYSYARTIEQGYRHWNLNLDKLYFALTETYEENSIKIGI